MNSYLNNAWLITIVGGAVSAIVASVVLRSFFPFGRFFNRKYLSERMCVLALGFKLEEQQASILKETLDKANGRRNKFKIKLKFTTENPGICVDIVDIGKTILRKSQKKSQEPDVSNTIYAVEEAKKK